MEFSTKTVSVVKKVKAKESLLIIEFSPEEQKILKELVGHITGQELSGWVERGHYGRVPCSPRDAANFLSSIYEKL